MKPESVKAAAQRADDVIRSLSAVPADAGAPPVDEDDDTLLSGDDDTTTIATADDDRLEPPAAPVVAQATDLEQRLKDTEAALQKADNRWKTLDGMIRAQNQQIENYQQLLANVPAADSQPPAGQSGGAPTTFTQSDVDQFGEDWVEFVHRVAKEIVRAEVGRLSTDMAGLKGTVEQQQRTVAVTAQERFEMKLDELAPGWRKYDADDKFIDWLRASRVNSAGFSQGVESLDHIAVAEVFNAYAQLTAPSPAAANAQGKRQRQLEAQVSPGKSRQSPPAVSADTAEKNWTLSEIRSAYARQTNRDTRLPRNEFSALERDISKAQKDGRVDYNA